MKILDLLPVGVQAKPNKVMEKEIQRRSSTILLNRVGVKLPPGSPENGSRSANVTFADDAKSKSGMGKASAGDAARSVDVFTFDKGDADDVVAEAKATHRRVYDASADRHFYVNGNTGESMWAPPKEGIINCIDESTGKTFFTNAKTKKTAWTIEAVI